MTVHVLDKAFQTATERSSIRNWEGKTIGLRIDKVNTNDEGAATSLNVSVFTTGVEGETPADGRIEAKRIIGQLAGYETGDIVVVHVVPYGNRGQVLAPPAEGDKVAEALVKALA